MWIEAVSVTGYVQDATVMKFIMNIRWSAMMMCDVMPTISEDGVDRDSFYSDGDGNFEQMMVNMLDERDKLVEALREAREASADNKAKLQEIQRARDALQEQMSSAFPRVTILNTACHWLIPPVTGDMWSSGRMMAYHVDGLGSNPGPHTSSHVVRIG